MMEVFTAPVVSVIVEKDDNTQKILLQKRIKAEVSGLENLYELPQGRIREGETFIDCAIREIYEETGLTEFKTYSSVNVNQVLGERLESSTVFLVSESGQHSYMAVCLIGKAIGIPRASLESSNPGWYSRDEVLDLIKNNKIFPLNVPMLLNYYNQKYFD